MKDSMRKKSKKGAEEGEDANSINSDSAGNPWATEATKEPETTLSPQASKVTNGTTDAGSKETTSEISPAAPRAENPANAGDDSQSISKPARRRKTVTDTPPASVVAEESKPVKEKKVKKSKTVSTEPESTTTTLPIHSSPATNGHTESPSVIEQLEKASTSSRKANNPFAPSTHTRKTSSYTNGSTTAGISNPCRYTPPQLNHDTFFGKVVVITHGNSPIGQSIIRKLHAVGSRVVFGDTNSDQAKRFISSLGPPDIIHANPCEPRNYSDMLELFKLAVSMYGRVDHAIFGVAEDGGQAGSVGQGERGLFEEPKKKGKDAIAAVQTEGGHVYEDYVMASARFARIALAYLQHTPNPAKTSLRDKNPSREKKSSSADRSLTFITSVAAFKTIPGLPVYQATQHATLGLIRSLSSSIDPLNEGVRINAVATNMMIPRTAEASRGRMSVIIPPDNPEDISRLVAGVVAGTSTDENGHKKTGIWYEDSRGRLAESYLHGRLLFTTGGECWDIQEGIERSEFAWFGGKPSDTLATSLDGIGTGKNWILEVL